MIPSTYFLVVAAFLFCIGLSIALTKQNAILVLMGIELMLNAANLNLVVFGSQDSKLSGQIFALFVMLVAAAEVAIALAIILKIYDKYHEIDLFKVEEIKEIE